MDRQQTIIVGIVAFIVLGLFLVFLGILPGLKSKTPAPFTLEVWGFADDDVVWKNIIKPFEQKYQYIQVHYTRFKEENYEKTLVDRLAENTGPDVFMLKNTWFLKHKEKLYPLPQAAFNVSVNSFDSAFVDLAHNDLVTPDGSIYGAPLSADSLALLYNKDLLNAAGIAKPPANWDEVVSASKLLTEISPAGDIVHSGIALGSGKNIAHFLELISAFMMQNGDPIVDWTYKLVMDKGSQDALSFYTSFADRTKDNFSWSDLLPNSIDAFAQEKTAMIFGVSGDIARIKEKNPHINIGVAPFPQLTNTNKPLTFGIYNFLAVSKLSKHSVGAWQFILFATGQTGAEIYTDGTAYPPARRDIIAEKAPPLEREVFWRQALTAKSWPIPDYPATEAIFQDAIESLSFRSESAPQAFNQLKQQLRLLLP